MVTGSGSIRTPGTPAGPDPVVVTTPTAAPMFVGRDTERATVVSALADGPSLVIVTGEPGIGKSRLVREAVGSDDGRLVVWTACPPVPEPFPLAPVVDGIRRRWPRLPVVDLSPISGALRPLFPEWRDELPAAVDALDTPSETRHRLFRALIELIDRLAIDVLVVEDLHDADTATIELLLTMAATPDPRTSIVVTYRPDDVPDGSLLRRLTSRIPVAMSRARVELGPLGVADTARLVGSMVGTTDLSDDFTTFLARRTDGVPLAVEETVRLLAERHDIVRQDGHLDRRFLDTVEVPPTIRDSVLERVDRLPESARRILEAAAVLAAPAAESLLADVAELDSSDGATGVAAALASGLLRETDPGRYAFRHILDAQAVGEAIPISRRRHLHGVAGTMLAHSDPDAVEQLSRHFRESGDQERWRTYAEAAADVAAQSGDDRTAVSTLLHVLDETDGPIDRRLRLARKLGEAAFFGVMSLGDLVDRITEELGRVVADPRLTTTERGELRHLLGRMLWRAGFQRAAFDAFDAAVPDLEHRPDLALLVMSNLALPLVPDWPAERHRAWVRRTGEFLNRHPELASAMVTSSRATALLLLGDDAGWRFVDDLDRPGAGPPSNMSEQRGLVVGRLNVAGAAMLWGRYDEASRHVHLAKTLADLSGGTLTDEFRLFEAYFDWHTGRWDGLADRIRDLSGDDAEAHYRLQTQQLLSMLAVVGGHRGPAERTLAQIAQQYQELGIAEPMIVLPSVTLARLALADGDPAAALALTTPPLEMIVAKDAPMWLADIAPVHLDALITVGRVAEARALTGDLAVGLVGRHAPGPEAALLTCRARLAAADGDAVRAAEHYLSAAQIWAELPRPYEESLAREAQARCLLDVGAVDEALAVLTRCQTHFSELGARWDADRVAQVLRQHGIEVARTWRRGRRGYGEELSPREREVLTLIAQGMTNREVGQALFLSPRTVGRHVSSIMRKLHVTSRTAAAMAAADAGLLPRDADSDER